MNKNELSVILANHAKWLKNEEQGVRAGLQDANLQFTRLVKADLRCAEMRNVDLRCANLCEANLRNADLREADLYGADLQGADLRGADLRGVKGFLYLTQRSDGYTFYLTQRDTWLIRAGCRLMTIAQYRTHVQGYENSVKQRETTAILDFAEIRLALYNKINGTG